MKQINVSNIMHEIERELLELNDGEWEWRFFSPEKIKPMLEEVIDQIDFYLIDYIFDYGVYWCGILTLEPWCELDRCEETILNELLRKNTELVVSNDELILRYKENPESFCHKIFEKYPDGFGGNIEASFNGVLNRVEKIIEKTLNDNVSEREPANKWGEWGQDSYCAACDARHTVFWSDPPHCPDCNQEYQESYA